MVIIIASGEYPPLPGGVGDYTQRLGMALAERGHQTYVSTIAAGQFTVYDLSNGTVARRSPPGGWGWRSWRALDAALDTLRPDVLHIQYQTGAYAMHPAINLLPWHLRRRATRPRLVVTMHDLLLPYLFPKAAPARRWVTRRLVRDADAVVVTNASDLKEVRNWRSETDQVPAQSPISNPQSPIPSLQSPVSNPQSLLIPIGSNIPVAPPPGYAREQWRAQLGVRTDETLVAYFGLISRSKGLDVLLAALARLPQRVRLLIVGGAATTPHDSAFAAAIERQIAALGLRRRVQRSGHVAPAEVSAHLLAADIAALPFADGASPRRGSLLAALAHGVATVTTGDGRRATGDGGQAANEDYALFVPAGDAAALAAAITRLADDAALRARLGAAGQAFAQQFGWAAIAEAHERVYNGLARGDGSKASQIG